MGRSLLHDYNEERREDRLKKIGSKTYEQSLSKVKAIKDSYARTYHINSLKDEVIQRLNELSSLLDESKVLTGKDMKVLNKSLLEEIDLLRHNIAENFLEYSKKESVESVKKSVSEDIDRIEKKMVSLKTSLDKQLSDLTSQVGEAAHNEKERILKSLENKVMTFERRMKDAIRELDHLKSYPKSVENLIKKINLPTQRSLSIPVAVDEGGTGLTNNNYIYLGGSPSSPTTGMWRFSISGTDLIAERYESSSWVNKGGFTA